MTAQKKRAKCHRYSEKYINLEGRLAVGRLSKAPGPLASQIALLSNTTISLFGASKVECGKRKFEILWQTILTPTLLFKDEGTLVQKL
ncbi:hypothetical protein SKAU_G00112630 [Synaphobranchus kaupii]|uniref:Uncharacterized protein n=1 Tax=Synaphobranchus kaupii TaxID=118154 RepID=A0A9Q1J6D4_SYNKA|nr:hypothetical protein SKAU_G00112630 [Synaphobranchus kaupii]